MRPETNFGRQIKVRRAVMDMNQRQLAEYLGVSQVLVSNWEKGRCLPQAKHLKLVAEKLTEGDVTVLFTNEVVLSWGG